MNIPTTVGQMEGENPQAVKHTVVEQNMAKQVSDVTSQDTAVIPTAHVYFSKFVCTSSGCGTCQAENPVQK